MSILLSGDFHANSNNELNIITRKSLIKKYKIAEFNKIKYHIILGDCGFLWPGNRNTDLFNFKVLANRPFPILCVIGNHEPIFGMNNLPEADIGIGETVYQICNEPFIAYLKRGKVYTIDGIKFLVLGGALSIDKEFRKPNLSWWEREYWSTAEKQELFFKLGNEKYFDFALSHTGPHNINKRLFDDIIRGYPKEFVDEVALLNNEIDNIIHVKKWYCGHWHQDKYFFDEKIKRGYQYLYKTTEILY